MSTLLYKTIMYKKYNKRILDIIISFILLIILIIPMFIVMLITLIDLGRPIIDIRIKREGKNKKPFYMYKIRTRIYDEKGNSTYSKTSKMIDKLNLNEIPQLFNVLKGDMSIIGPRPFICNEKLPEGEISYKRYLVKPGIIGLAHSLGGRELSYIKTLECDVVYYDNLSFKFDVKILINSIKTWIRQVRGALCKK